ncbi:MAG TPA: hypothetical protein VEB22_00430, partial [Phycisphaerales bacterium]|nr:hypothetical protein [Phycisphaerales bacterium]
MASKRISDIAKELGVASKLIIQKCVDEGVPADKVKSHASVVSAGLEASIREWFSTGSVATAIETKEHVDVDKARSANHPRKRTGKADGEHGDDHHDAQGDSTTATAPTVTPSIAAPTRITPSAAPSTPSSPVVVPHKPTSVPEPRTVEPRPAAAAPA